MGPQGQLEFVKHEGFPEGLLVLKAGSAALNALTFHTGTIEFDLKALSSDMPGMQFRVSGNAAAPDGEEVYLRLFGDCRASNDCIQYAPLIHGFMLWNVYPQYQRRALVLDGWNHVRLVVSEHRFQAFLNDQPQPALSVGNLESGSLAGSLHLRGPAIFANLIIQPGVVDALPSEPVPDPSASDPGIPRIWQMSTLSTRRDAKAPEYADMPKTPQDWRLVKVERGGLLNLNRQYSATEDPAALGWLRLSVDSDRDTVKRLSLGWLGQVWVFVNGRFLTQGKNFYEPENERRPPDGRLSLENGAFDVPLHKGRNEIAIALCAQGHDDLRPRTKYGWGVSARFASPQGLHLLTQNRK